MSYKPNYCNQCGEQVERTDWKLWHSRRFCELCADDYIFEDWKSPIAGITVGLMLLFTGAYYAKSEKPLNVQPNNFVSTVQTNRNAPVVPNRQPLQKAEAAPAEPVKINNSPPVIAAELPKAPVNLPVEAAEKIYFCGAMTKKGTLCSRRVKGGGRCWQHDGQESPVAQEKLLIVQ